MTWQFCLLSVIRYPESTRLLRVVLLRKIIVSAGGKKKKKEKSISLSKDRSNFRADIFLSWSCSLAQAPCCNRQLREGFFCFFFSGNHRLELLRMAPSAPEGRYRRLLLLTGKEERICREDLGLKPLLPCTNFLA